MPITSNPAMLESALRRLSELSDPAGRADVEALAERLRGGRPRVLVAGEAKRGKSTLVNALLGRPVLPTGVTPLTALPTTLVHDDREYVAVEYTDGRREQRPVSALAELVTESGNPANRLDLERVVVHLPSPFLAIGAEIVDTPGTGSVHAHNTTVAEAALETMDAAVFVLSAEPPISAAERDLLKRVSAVSITTFVVLNKTDYLSISDRHEALTFTQEVTRRRVYPIAAKTALTTGEEPGFAAFRADLAKYLRTAGGADLRESVARHATLIAKRLRDQAMLETRAAQMRARASAQRVATFRDRLGTIRSRGIEAVDIAAGEGARLLADLNESADDAAHRLTARIHRAVTTHLERHLGDAAAADIQNLGRAHAVELTRTAVRTWRSERRQRLEAGLTSLHRRLVADLNTELATVRSDAADLLGLDLAIPRLDEQFLMDRDIHLQLTENVGQTELLAGAVRRLWPGEAGRRRVRRHLLAEVDELVPRQVGRCRADLQYRLTDGIRKITAIARRHFEEAVDGLAKALDAASEDYDLTTTEVRARRAKRQRHVSDLDDVIGELEDSWK